MTLKNIKKMLKNANDMHKAKLFARATSGGNVVLWVYKNYKRMSLGLPSINISNKERAMEKYALIKKAIEMRDNMERNGDDEIFKMNKKLLVSVLAKEWANNFASENSRINSEAAINKFIAANGDMPVCNINRRHIIKVIDGMKQNCYHINTTRYTASKIRAFCNWAEQRGYMGRVDTRKLLPPEQFGEVKALSEEELRLLANTPCNRCPDVKDLFMLGVYTAQRTGEIKNYTFATLYDGKIKTRQGKTGKFIIIPLSENALAIMRKLKERREMEGKNTGEKDKMFNLPSEMQICRVFKIWLEAAGIDRNRITLHNSRSTAISLLINKGVPESITQELANHADPRITAKYYRQIDDAKKKEALSLIMRF
jgi:integrase